MTAEMQKIADSLNKRDFNSALSVCMSFLSHYMSGTDAEKVAGLAVKLAPKDSDILNTCGVVYFNNGKYREAAETYSAALKLNPHSFSVLLNYANLLYKLGQLKQAEYFYNEGLKYADKNLHPQIIRSLATIYMDRSQPEKALELLFPLYENDPQNQETASVIGNAYVCMQGHDDEVEKYYLSVLSSGYNSDSINHNLALLYDRMKNYDKAKYHSDIAFNINAVRYGADFSDWPKNEKALRDIYYYNRLYNAETDNQNVFVNSDFDNEIAKKSLEYKKINDRQSVVHINDIYLDGNGWPLFKDKKIFGNMTFTVMEKYPSFAVVTSRNGTTYTMPWDNAEIIDEPSVFLGGATNYYHWMIDFLPRLEMLKNCPELSGLPVLINEDIKKFQIESLNAIGFDISRLKQLSFNKRYLFKDVYILHHNNRPLTAHKTPDWMNPAVDSGDIDWLRREFSALMKTKTQNPKRLFLSRKGANFRLCLNEDEIFEIAKEYGFEKVQNENMSFAEQISLYSGVEAVMGVHGAGFTNMVFAPENAVLIELHSLNELPVFYKRIAGLIGQTHIAIDGIVQETLRPAPQPFWNFEVDPEKVRAVLKERLG